ncbi:MAG TPA: D-alanine--D-alanine ligase [Caldithrix abyssi]|uniref:D-alanine--D-alanine ligase n=1 Tax=Caldithrix abyssi TaxID=187145 RepID=A0A7V4TZ92_CALAY|nr:D-alanine--D-alanine ligase [Caldithrix abyssi]
MKIVVLMGGDSTERDVSLVSGDQIAKTLVENGHEVIKIDPSATRDEQTELNKTDIHWIGLDYPSIDALPLHRSSLYLKNIMLVRRLRPDIVFNALHGGKGENGIVQGMLEAAEIPYTGSGMLASAIAMQKDISKMFFRQNNIPTPRAVILERPDSSRKKLKNARFPQVVKPNDQGSTIGLHIVERKEELDAAIDDAFKFKSKVLVEEYIPGKEITVSVIRQRTLPVIEIIPEHGLYDYECKYKEGMSRYEVPARLSDEVTRQVQNIAFKAHQALGCTGYSRVDMRLNEQNEPYVLEVNTLPGMTGTSLVPKAAKAAGINFNSLVEMIVEEGLKKK